MECFLNEDRYKEIFISITMYLDDWYVPEEYCDINFNEITCKPPKVKALFIKTLDMEVIEIAKQYEKIVFDYEFVDNNNLINSLPNNIKCIIFDYESYFYKPIYNYPPLLEYIKFGIHFNQSIDYLPITLKYLILGYRFNQNLYNIPNNIEFISLDQDFNYPLDNLNDNIKILYLYCDDFTYPICKLPKKLEKIRLTMFKPIILDNNCFAELLNLKEIDLGFGFDSSLDNIKWSDSIKVLKFGENFNQQLDNLPKYLEYIQVGSAFDIFENINYLPQTMKEFTYIDGFPKCIDKANRIKNLGELFPHIKFIHN